VAAVADPAAGSLRPVQLPVMPPVAPMLAKPYSPARGKDVLPPGDLLFEPKWDGFRAVVFRDGDEIEIGSRHDRPLTRYFPELVPELAAVLPERCVVDGEVVIATPDGLDFDALQQRIHPAVSRINRLAAETPASFVAFDLLALGDESYLDRPLQERRAALEGALAGARPPIHLTPVTADRDLARDWFVRFEGAGLDGVIAKDPAGVYEQDRRVQLKVKHKRTADCVVAGYRVHKSGDGVGSLLLGLYDDEGVLHHVGVASSFTAAKRPELFEMLQPYREGALDDHPWKGWAEAVHDAEASNPPLSAARAAQRKPGGFSRWNVDKDLSFTFVRCELVAEVAYENLLNNRLRHGARLQRWRPDRDPTSCTYAQLDQAPPYELHEIFGV
jgi:ATP-dependent DNA ligase